MGLSDLWVTSRGQFEDKHLQQIITFAGDGQLKDGGVTSIEFREFLSVVPSALLSQYTDDCLLTPFAASGLALQDVVNQIGRRLGFRVTDGRYRGVQGQVGFDGLWHLPNGHAIVVEVKTTDTYRIGLDTIAGYRQRLISDGIVNKDASSVLIIVGREDTGGLEAQIRGSRHAWDMRLVSVDALLRLMLLKESLDDPSTIRRIYDILIPREFTRLDEIVELVFSAAEEAKQEEVLEEEDISSTESESKPLPMAFHEQCIARVEEYFGSTLIRQSRTGYLSPDSNLAVTCAVSKEHTRKGHISYWFAFRPYQKEFLEQSTSGYAIFGCGSAEKVLLIPFSDLQPWLNDMWTTENGNRFYWHVNIQLNGSTLLLDRKKPRGPVDVTGYLLSVKSEKQQK
jgi:hypothetical protein